MKTLMLIAAVVLLVGCGGGSNASMDDAAQAEADARYAAREAGLDNVFVNCQPHRARVYCTVTAEAAAGPRGTRRPDCAAVEYEDADLVATREIPCTTTALLDALGP
jgi:hypothetical protein